jgi:folate-binding protein YgfZ
MKSLPLEEFHKQQGAKFMDWAGWSIPANYGDPEKEYRAILEQAAMIDLTFRDTLELSGDDRTRFLNGQTTNDVASLAPGRAIYSAFVNAKGKMRADANILCFEDRYLVDVEPGLGEPLAADLDKFIIADDVSVAIPEPRKVHLLLLGPKAPAALQAIGLPTPSQINRFEVSSDRWILRSYFGPDAAFDVFLPAEAAAQSISLAAERVSPVGWAALEQRRIELGLPRFGVDMDGATLPPEAAIEDRAISYTKGCYIGQEVISRIKSVGHVNRRLARLRLEGVNTPPPQGVRLMKGSEEVGVLTSSARVPSRGWLALGYIRRGKAGPSERLKAEGFEAIVL